MGIATEIIGSALLTWQEQDVYTVNGEVTIPAWAAMLVAVLLLSIGFGRILRTASPHAAHRLSIGGAAAGATLVAAALAWQLAVGLTPSDDLALEVYAAFALFFVGVAVLTRGADELARRSAAHAPPVSGVPPSSAPPPRGIVAPAALFVLGAAFLAIAGLGYGWLDSHAANTTSLYQLVAFELAFGGAWFLLAGARGVHAALPARRAPTARRVSVAAGLALVVVGGGIWWATAPLVYALGEILLAGFALSGIGLLLVRRA